MKQCVSVSAAVIVALSLLTQTANAGAKKPYHRDPSLTAASLGVGAGWTAGYFALRDWKLNSHGKLHGLSATGAVALTTIGCMAASPIVGTIMVQRELTFREAYALTADCLIPFVGAWLVNKAFDDHPEWEPRKVKVRAKR